MTEGIFGTPERIEIANLNWAMAQLDAATRESAAQEEAECCCNTVSPSMPVVRQRYEKPTIIDRTINVDALESIVKMHVNQANSSLRQSKGKYIFDDGRNEFEVRIEVTLLD